VASVVTIADPRKTFAAPKPEPSQAAAAKNSRTNVVLAAASRVPSIVVLEASATTDVISGKFCRPLTPESASQGSFGVGPSPPRSIGRPPFP